MGKVKMRRMVMILRCFVVCDGDERGGKASFVGGMSFFVACGDCFVVCGDCFVVCEDCFAVCEGKMKFAAFVLLVDEVALRLAGGVLLLAGVFCSLRL
jgi:hypothetical protein